MARKNEMRLITGDMAMKCKTVIMTAVGLGLMMANNTYAERAGASTDLRLDGVYVSPKKDGWDNGIGGELKYIYWANPNLGLALAGGAQQWKVSKDVHTELLDSSTAVAVAYDGNAMFYPVGVSVLCDLPLNNTISLSLEGGLRYVIASSDVKVAAAVGQINNTGAVGVSAGESNMTFDNGVIAKAAIDLNLKVNEETTVSIGAGYDFDISKGDWHDGFGDSGTYSLEAFFARVGISIRI